MTSDAILSFLDLARTHRLLPPGDIETLLQQPEVPLSDLTAFCEFLQSRGTLSAYQLEKLQKGDGQALSCAGYPIVDQIGPCAGGLAYKALHPSLRTPLVLRRLQWDWLAPADNPATYVLRAQAACPLSHPHIVPLLDAGAFQNELFVVLEPDDGSDLGVLVSDIGAMPANLAVEYGRQAATAIRAIHDRCLVHGHVHPGCLRVGPLVTMAKSRPDGSPRMRPSATARVRLAELGLIPFRPSLAAGLVDPTQPVHLEDHLTYLPPERVKSAERTQAGDVYGLGASIYFLLTGKAPFTAERTGELLDQLEHNEPVSLSVMRPDCPPDLVALIQRMMARDPIARPSAADVVEQLNRLIPSHPAQSAPAVPPPTPPIAAADPHPNMDIHVPNASIPQPATPAPVSAEPVPIPVPQPMVNPVPPGWSASPFLGSQNPAIPSGYPSQQPSLPPQPVAYPPQYPVAYPQPPMPTYPQSPGYPQPQPVGYPQPQPVGYPQPQPMGYPQPGYPQQNAAGWTHPGAAYGHDDFTQSSSDDGTPTRVRRPVEDKSGNWVMWVIAGAVLNILAVAGWFYLFMR